MSVKSSGSTRATLRNWVENRYGSSESTAADAPGDPSAELKALRRENAELRMASEILKTASAFFAAAQVDHRHSSGSIRSTPCSPATASSVDGSGDYLP
jgi:transposase-like protein